MSQERMSESSVSLHSCSGSNLRHVSSPVSIQTHATHARSCVRKIHKQNKKCARNAINARKLRKQKHCVRFFTLPTQAPANRNGRSKQPIIEAANQALALLAVFVYVTHASHATHAIQARCLWMETGLQAKGSISISRYFENIISVSYRFWKSDIDSCLLNGDCSTVRSCTNLIRCIIWCWRGASWTAANV